MGRLCVIGLFLFTLTACPELLLLDGDDDDDGGSGSSGGQQTEETQQASDFEITRVEIVQTALFLTEPGDTRQLEARAYDADGQEVPTNFKWRSSSKGDITVNRDGTAKAKSANGSAQITATSVKGNVESAPLVGVVAAVAEGVQTLRDEQILSGPFVEDPEAEPSLTNIYCIDLAEIDTPMVGDLLVGAGEIPVAGEVVSVDTADGVSRVCLKLVPLAELFPELEINEHLDLNNAEVTINEEIAELYTVTRDGNTWRFRPKADDTQGDNTQSSNSRGDSFTMLASRLTSLSGLNALARLISGNAYAASGAQGTTSTEFNFNQGCEDGTGVTIGGASTPLPFSIPEPPLIDISLNPGMDILYLPGQGLEKFILHAQPQVIIDGKVKFDASFEAKITCKAELLTIKIPIGGALSFLIGGLVPVGIGFEVGGKGTIEGVEIGLKSESKATATLGVQCTPDCEFVRELGDFFNQQTPVLNTDNADDFRFEPSLLLFGRAAIAVGNPLIPQLSIEGFTLTAGPKLTGDFAARQKQIDDSNYKSSYKLLLEAVAKAGGKIEQFFNLLSLGNFATPQLKIEQVLSESPAGTVSADTGSFSSGQIVHFDVELDPNKISFLSLYNIEEILLLRDSGNSDAYVITQLAAADNQVNFAFDWQADTAGGASEIFAFVITRALPLDWVSLEIDKASGPPPAGQCTITPATATMVFESPDGPVPETVTFTATDAYDSYSWRIRSKDGLSGSHPDWAHPQVPVEDEEGETAFVSDQSAIIVGYDDDYDDIAAHRAEYEVTLECRNFGLDSPTVEAAPAELIWEGPDWAAERGCLYLDESGEMAPGLSRFVGEAELVEVPEGNGLADDGECFSVIYTAGHTGEFEFRGELDEPDEFAEWIPDVAIDITSGGGSSRPYFEDEEGEKHFFEEGDRIGGDSFDLETVDDDWTDTYFEAGNFASGANLEMTTTGDGNSISGTFKEWCGGNDSNGEPRKLRWELDGTRMCIPP